MPDGGPRPPAVSTARAFDELFEALPLRGIKQAEVAEQGSFPVVDQSAARCAGWSDDEARVYCGALPALVFCDHTRRFKLLERPFVPVGEGLVVLRPREGLDPVFAHHLLRGAELPDRGYARHFGLLRALTFRVPSLERQRAMGVRLQRAQQCLERARSRLETAGALAHELERSTILGGLDRQGQPRPFEDCFGVQAWKGTARLSSAGRFVVVDQGPTKARGRTDDADRLVAEVPVIVFGDHTRCVRWVDEPFVPASDGVKVLRARDSLDLRYGYWLLRSVQLRDAGYARHLRQLRRHRFLVPPLERQHELTRALDRAMERVEELHRRIDGARRIADAYPAALWTEALEAIR